MLSRISTTKTQSSMASRVVRPPNVEALRKVFVSMNREIAATTPLRLPLLSRPYLPEWTPLATVLERLPTRTRAVTSTRTGPIRPAITRDGRATPSSPTTAARKVRTTRYRRLLRTLRGNKPHTSTLTCPSSTLQTRSCEKRTSEEPCTTGAALGCNPHKYRPDNEK